VPELAWVTNRLHCLEIQAALFHLLFGNAAKVATHLHIPDKLSRSV
jgi:hypothetical protein